MKSIAWFLVLFLALSQPGFSQAPQTPAQATGKKPIENYRDVLDHLPKDLSRGKATKWTQVQRAAANEALKKALVEANFHGKFKLKVSEIADWDGMTFYSDVPNNEGYHIRVFGKFTNDWKPKLASLKKGDTAILEGALSFVTYHDLWGAFTLSICMKDCKFTK